MLNLQPSIQDLWEVDPNLSKSLVYLERNFVDPDVFLKELEYEIILKGKAYTQEVIKGGGQVELDENNKNLYIQNLTMCKLYRESKIMIDLIKQELYKVVPADILQILTPPELSLLLSGESTISANEIINTLRTVGFDEKSQIVTWFSEILREFDQIKLSHFMFFATGKPRWLNNILGSSKVAVNSLRQRPITLAYTAMGENQLPLSHSW